MEQNAIGRDAILICIGNEYREDDGLGLYIGRHAKIRCLPNLRIIENSGDGMAMVDAWKDGRTVIVVDAVHSGRPPGTLFYFDLLENRIPSDVFTVSTHNIGIFECVALSKKLGLLPEKLIFYGIEVADSGYGRHLSPLVKGAADSLVEKIAVCLV